MRHSPPNRLSLFSGIILAANLSAQQLSNQPLDPHLTYEIFSLRSNAYEVLPDALGRGNWSTDPQADHPQIFSQCALPALPSLPKEILETGNPPSVFLNLTHHSDEPDSYGLGVNCVPLIEIYRGKIRTSFESLLDRIRASFNTAPSHNNPRSK